MLNRNLLNSIHKAGVPLPESRVGRLAAAELRQAVGASRRVNGARVKTVFRNVRIRAVLRKLPLQGKASHCRVTVPSVSAIPLAVGLEIHPNHQVYPTQQHLMLQTIRCTTMDVGGKCFLG